MPRIELDDDFLGSQRFIDLSIKLGDQHLALGWMVSAWCEAWKYWIQDQKLIPKKVWDELGFPKAIIDSKLATEFSDGIKMRGIKKRFQWWFDCKDKASAAGKKSAEIRAKKYGSSKPSMNKVTKNAEHAFMNCERPFINREPALNVREPDVNSREPDVNSREPDVNPHEPSYSYSNSFSNSNSLTNSKKENKSNTGYSDEKDTPLVQKPRRVSGKSPKEPCATTELWDIYNQEFVQYWKKDPPPRNAQVNSLLSRLLSNFGKENAIKVIKHYFKIRDAYYHKSFHPVGLLVKQGHQIFSSMSTGVNITNTQMRQMDQQASAADKIEKIRSGQI
jgi:hypothetical protein